MNKTKITLLLIFTILVNITAKSQLIGGEAFLQGTYLEVGVAACGSYGTDGTSPAGYHENSPLGGLGFVADPDQDGWAVGTPAYFGDYFLPGSPLEGWGIEFNGSSYFNASVCAVDDVPGSITDYTSTATTKSATWEGNISGVDIKMNTWFPNDALYFITDVTLYNTTATDIYDLYFLRHVDPDNEQTNSGDYTTIQDIVSQPDSFNCAALVTATGLIDDAYLGLGTLSSNAIVAYYETLGIMLPANIADVYNGVSPSIISGGNSSFDEPMSLTFKFDTILAGDSITFSYAYILDSTQLATALSQTGSYGVSANGQNITNTLSYSYCPLTPILVTLQIEGGYDWVWSPNVNFAGPNTGDSVVVVVNGDITYTVTGTSYDCGDITRIIVINADSNLLADAGPNQIICNGDSVQLQGTGESGFVWSPIMGLSDANIAQPMAYPPVNTTYTLNTSCGSDNVDVIIVPDFNTSFLPVDTICMYESTGITIVSNPPAVAISSIVWENATTLNTNSGNSVIADPIVTTTYTTTTTSVDGCVVEDTVSLIVSGLAPNILINPSDTTICAGASYAINVDYSPFIGDYSVTTVPYNMIAGSGTSVSLSDDAVSSALPIGFTFNFYGNNYTQFYISSNGFISFTDLGNGCCSGGIIPSNFNPSNLIAFAWEDLNPGAGGTIEYYVTGVAPNQVLIVNIVDVPHFGGGDLVNAQVILYEGTNQILINVGSQPDALGITTLGIENFDGTAGLSPAGYNSTQWTASNESWLFTPFIPNPISFTWTPSTYLDVDTGLFVVSTPADDISYTLTADNGNCASTANVTIHVDSSLSLINSSADIATCTNIGKELFVNVASTTPATYSWSPALFLNSTNSDTVISTANTDICYTVQIANSTLGCVLFDTICITASSLNLDSLIANHVSCNGGDDADVSVYASLGDTPYSYSIDGTTFQSSDLFSDLVAGTYTITVEDDEGCLNDASVIITEPSFVSINIQTEDTACFNTADGSFEIQFSGGTSSNGDYTYSINSSTPIVGSSPVVIDNLLGDTVYNVSIKDDNNCVYNTDFTLEEYDALIINVSEDSCNFEGETVALSVDGNYVSYSWTPTTNLSCSDCPNPIVTVFETNNYSLVVEDMNGCTSINDASVNVCLLLTDIVLPDAFTPNNDGLNDRFFDEALIPYGYELKMLNIYDRWGELVYSLDMDKNGWDGTFKDVMQKNGLYVYYVEFLTVEGEIKTFSGNINLLR